MTEKSSPVKSSRYEILRVLGYWDLGEIVLAQDKKLGRRVVIKRASGPLDDDGRARFEVEAKAAAVRHPNVPAVYEVGELEGRPFIAREYVEGDSLEVILGSKKELDLIARLEIIEQVCSALGHARKNGIVRRNLGPDNVLVQKDGVVKVVDFAVESPGNEGGNSGSRGEKSGEVPMAGFADGSADDLLRTGGMLFELLTGEEWGGFGDAQEAHAALGAILRDYPPGLDHIVARALARDARERYATGDDFAGDLHLVIVELKKKRVKELFDQAERLNAERLMTPAMELLDEAIRLDPSHAKARKLRKAIRQQQDRIRRADRLDECLLRTDAALEAGNLEEALLQLKNAPDLDAPSDEIEMRLRRIDEAKCRAEASARALAEAELVMARGDLGDARRMIADALAADAKNQELVAFNAALARQLEIESVRGRLMGLQEGATRALSEHDFDAADRLLQEAGPIDPLDEVTARLRAEWTRAKDMEQRAAKLEEVQARVRELIAMDAYDEADQLVMGELETRPDEVLLHQLKAQVEAEARNFDLRQVVDLVIAQAEEIFGRSPEQALRMVQQALENMPDEERLAAHERLLREQLRMRRAEPSIKK